MDQINRGAVRVFFVVFFVCVWPFGRREHQVTPQPRERAGAQQRILCALRKVTIISNLEYTTTLPGPPRLAHRAYSCIERIYAYSLGGIFLANCIKSIQNTIQIVHIYIEVLRDNRTNTKLYTHKCVLYRTIYVYNTMQNTAMYSACMRVCAMRKSFEYTPNISADALRSTRTHGKL